MLEFGNERCFCMKNCFVVPGPFLPYNDTITQLIYKQLRCLPYQYQVVSLKGPSSDEGLKKMLEEDPMYQKFTIKEVDDYNNVLFSIQNVNLFKGLRHMNRYVKKAISLYDGQPLVYTNSFPCYTIRVGKALKEKNPNITWIASFSDPINHSPYKFDQKTYDSYMLVEKVCFNLYCKYYVVDEDERDAFEHADVLVFICQEQRDFMIEQYRKYFGKLTEEEIRKKCVIVPLNYIEEWNTLLPLEETKKEDDVFVLSHFGRVYGLRLIEEFIEAVSLFVKKYPNVKLRIEQYGEFRKSDLKLIHALGLDDVFEVHKKIPYDACISKMQQSDAVLLFDTIVDESTIQPYLPSKILEYSLLAKNTLGITVKTSPSYRIMKESKAIVCRYDRGDILAGLEELVIRNRVSKIDYATKNKDSVKDLTEMLRKFD